VICDQRLQVTNRKSAITHRQTVVRLTVRVVTRASTPGIAGVRDGALLVRLQSPPVEGAANAELIELIAEAFGTVRRNVSIESGERSKLKRVAISAIEQRHVESVLRTIGIDPQSISSSSP
jgi:uncharacterized protein (TIGR00251 family)